MRHSCSENLEWCIERNIWISAKHLPGSENTVADRESRIFHDDTEWKLDVKIFNQFQEWLGHSDIDLFASRLNAHTQIRGLAS